MQRNCKDGAPDPNAPRKGRPVQIDTKAREEMILDAAERLILDGGLKTASMAAIVRQVGMSKRTVYEIFGSRDNLLLALVTRLGAQFARPLPPEYQDKPLETRLRALFRRPRKGKVRSLEVLRAIMAEAPNNPELARQTLEVGILRFAAIVAQELRTGVSRNEIDLPPDDIPVMGQMLIDMVYENPMARLLDPGSDMLGDDTRRDLALRLFLRAARC